MDCRSKTSERTRNETNERTRKNEPIAKLLLFSLLSLRWKLDNKHTADSSYFIGSSRIITLYTWCSSISSTQSKTNGSFSFSIISSRPSLFLFSSTSSSSTIKTLIDSFLFYLLLHRVINNNIENIHKTDCIYIYTIAQIFYAHMFVCNLYWY